MENHVAGKVVLVTGAGGGFGRLVCQRAARDGARVVCGDIDETGVSATADEIHRAGGQAFALRADVTALADMQAMAEAAIRQFGAIDVIVNNAGVMPLAFYRDHARAAAYWDRCIDINIKGVLNGMIATYDHMIAQGRGHVINISSIYGNFPVAGAGVYGATKAAVNFLSDSLRMESQGVIKVTTVRPTGVPGTGLGGGVINPEAISGVLGANTQSYMQALKAVAAGTAEQGQLDPDSPRYLALDPGFIADAVIAAIEQPWGVMTSDITVRATGDRYLI